MKKLKFKPHRQSFYMSQPWEKQKKKLRAYQLGYITTVILLSIVTTASFIKYWYPDTIKPIFAEEIDFISPEAKGSVVLREVPVYVVVSELAYRQQISNWVSQYSNQYGVPEHYVHCIIQHESRYNEIAVGDSGRAVGLGQFWPGTWEGFRKLMGEDPNVELRKNPEENIKTLVWALSENRDGNWSVVEPLKLCSR